MSMVIERPHERVDAEARGKLRVFKSSITPGADAIARVLVDRQTMAAAVFDLAKKRGIGQERAFVRLTKMMKPAVFDALILFGLIRTGR